MQQLISSLVALLVLAAVLSAIERRYAAIAGRKLLRDGWWLDVKYLLLMSTLGEFATRAAVFLALVPVVLIVYGGIPGEGEVLAGFGPLARQPAWLHVLEALLLADFIGYWLHRWFHQGWAWRIHAIHHSSTELDWLSSVRQHPANEMIGAALRALVLIPLGFSPAVVGAVTPFIVVYAFLLHANVDWSFGPLRYVIATPRFHRWHHELDAEAQRSNFAGLFPVFDLLFGTFHMPQDRRPRRFGCDEALPPGLWRQLKYPFQPRHNPAKNAV